MDCETHDFIRGVSKEEVARGETINLEDLDKIDWDKKNTDSNILMTYVGKVKTITGAKGADPSRFLALKLWDRCVSIEKNATGGDSAILVIDDNFQAFSSGDDGTLPHIYRPQHIRYYDRSGEGKVDGKKVKDGEDASGVANNTGEISGQVKTVPYNNYTTKSAWPELLITTNLHKVAHEIGYNGTSGKVVTVFESSLSDCTLTVPAGGRNIKLDDNIETIQNLQNNLTTTLRCNGGSVVHSAEGGEYRKMTYASDPVSEFDYMNDYKRKQAGEVLGADAFTKTIELPNEIKSESNSKYHYGHNIFTRYFMDDFRFGQGASGSKIIDRCMQPKGTYTHALKEYDGNIQNIGFNYPINPFFTCDTSNPAHFEKIPPSGAWGGAIIITW